ncbi:MAG: hypothetical protein WCF68_03940 [Terriglobales bacterium]
MRASGLLATLLFVVPIVGAQGNTPVWRNGAQEKMCGLGTYHDGLDLAFKNATAGGGETLVTVQVLPSFRREYALVLKRVGPEVRLLRATFQEQLWTHLGPPSHVQKTRQQCLDLALAAKVDTEELPVSPDTAAESWAAFSGIHRDADTCPRRGKQCAYPLDGTDYVVQTNDGRSLQITEIRNQKGIKSENAALLDWVRTLLQTASSSQQR